MSIATAMLEAGRVSLVAHHGETLTWLPASSVIKSETSEVWTTELGKAILSDEAGAITFTGNFYDAYQTIDASTGAIASTGPAVADVSPTDLPDADRGDIILRDGVQYSVIEVRPGGVAIVLLLSKHAH